MSTAELRNHLFSLIDALPANKLTEAYDMLREQFKGSLPADDAEPIESLPEWQREGLQEAIDELDRGEGIPHDKVWAELKEKYGLNE